MGWGDELMAAGEAARLHRETGKRVVIVDRQGLPRWSEVWEGNSAIARDHGPDTTIVLNAPGARPYIVAKSDERYTWKAYEPRPAELVLTPEERRFAAPYAGAILVEPHVLAKPHANKRWPFDRWQALVNDARLQGRRFVQCGPAGTNWLRNVVPVETSTFRRACALISVARAFVGTEGGLMHAAAATRTPAVILWSEFTSPDVSGYRALVNLRHAGKACGSRRPCAACASSMDAIRVDEVVVALLGLLARA